MQCGVDVRVMVPSAQVSDILPTRSPTMAAMARKKAEKIAGFRCTKCHEQMHVKWGDKLPKCPNCRTCSSRRASS